MATYEAMVKVLLQISRTDLAEKISILRKSSLRSLLTPVVSTLRELEEEFYDLVIFIEDTLENSRVSLDTITRRFRMLPRSIQRRYETDENYKETRRRILRSKTIKKLFDNLTELKH